MVTVRKLILFAAAAAALAGCSTAAPSNATPSATPVSTAVPSFGPAAVTIEAHGETPTSFFTPKQVVITAGDVLRLVDVGDTEHDFTIDVGGAVPTKPSDQHIAFQIHVDLLNRTNQAAINLPPGTYQFYCSISLGNVAGHAVNGMVGTITVH
jgi:plastocyanin